MERLLTLWEEVKQRTERKAQAAQKIKMENMNEQTKHNLRNQA
jgi:hypothetical protein